MQKIILSIFIFSLSLAQNSVVRQFSKAFADVAEKAKPAVVTIITDKVVSLNQFDDFGYFFFQPNIPRQREYKTNALGSGVIVDADKGYILTNNHVVDDMDGIRVKLIDKREYDAVIIGTDPKTDLAVLQIEADNLKDIKLGDSDGIRVGEWVMAVGSPFSENLSHTVTTGIISALGRSNIMNAQSYEDFIQTDAAINPGNSGGALLNMEGELVGINTAILGQSGSIGIGFAIPSNSAQRVINQLIEFGETKRGWLGVRIQVVTQDIVDVEKLDKPRGALVVSVASGSPSDKAGILSGDIILEFDGKEITEMKELPKIVAQTDVGKKVSVKIWRNQKEITKTITLGRLETSEDFQTQKTESAPKTTLIKGLKISVRKLTKEDIELRNLPSSATGAVITEIDKDSPLNYLSVNNIIIEAQKKKIKTVGDLQNIVNSRLRSSDKTILIAIINNQNQKRYIGVKLD